MVVEVAQLLLLIRQWERQSMPMPSSGISCEIIYLVAARSPNDPACVKDLFLTLGYSEARVSEVLRALILDGWIEQKASSADKRKRTLYPSEKCTRLLGTSPTVGLISGWPKLAKL
jgi:DNA-binding MarR family transcriptional regulator